ncbi:bifunctional 3'-5' exonuclease/ATP-dependent helicase WRN-like [Sabethes cyaneus]|uniref:bifunctional 3'-5' exonuclease/ATP-dependent helicase WRN-like n=1 Tax=Sabethes cyaneus TaxID=53552 RepID=UPI00237E0647|nr:bifunctional 3'-5' exonuclease/ATP-dependent helicase WRN-like [Sabethes cyaneus]
MAESDEPQPAHLAALASHFGHSCFRPMQWTIIRSILEDRRDNCVIMATGYGKSLTYQFPSVFLGRTTIVISPLISLMEDQVLSLNLSNIPACLLGSAQRANPLPDIKAGKFRVIYLTPEYVTGDSGKYLLEHIADQLVLIAIDEAHCLSKWGHDFRPAYRNLGVIRKLCPMVPILAVTATATLNVREDIINCLKLRNPQTLCTGFDRPNLEFHVKMKGSLGVWEDLRGLLSKHSEGSIIIYCLTRKQTEEIVELLKNKRVECEPYHAGLGISQRRNVHESFVRDRIQIIVATIAFGMGIDKPDVRLVIHYGASKDIESYYQEAGRAGRDGQPSKCVMFWSRADFKTHEILREYNPGGVQKNMEALSKKMHEYLDTRECRRRFILKYFEEKDVVVESRKHCCDNCDRTVGGVKDSERYDGIDEQGNYDFGKDSEYLLNAIDVFGGGTGISLPIALLRGSKSKKLNERYWKHPLHGIGKSKDDEWWKALAVLLEREGFLNKVKLQNNYCKFALMYKVQPTPLAKKWLATSDRKLMMKPTAEMFKSLRLIKVQPLYNTDFQSQRSVVPKMLPLPTVHSVSSLNNSRTLESIASKQDIVQDLVKSLLKKRSELATSYECMPYMIASNLALHQMATIRPLNLDEMKNAQLDGFSDIKIHKFGKSFLSCIQEKLNFLPNNDNSENSLMQTALQCNPFTKSKFSSTHQTTWNLWLEGRSVADIGKFRNLAEGTVISHLCEAIKHGFPFGFNDFTRIGMAKTTFDHIKSKLPTTLEGCKMTDIKNQCLPHVTFDQIKLVLSYVSVRRHLELLNVQLTEDNQSSEEVKTTTKNLAEDLWGEEDEELSVAESSFAEIDRICKEASCSKKDLLHASTGDHIDIDDDDEEFDLDEIAALERAVMSDQSDNRIPTTHTSVKSKGIIYNDETESEATETGRSPAKQAKIEPVVTEVTKPSFTFKIATSAAVIGNRLANKKIVYEDSDDDDVVKPSSISKTANSAAVTKKRIVNKKIIYDDSDDDDDNGFAKREAMLLPRRKV